MTKEFCDVCGKELNTNYSYEYRVTIRKKIYGWDFSYWRKLAICECCKEAVVSKSKEIRKKRNE